MPLWWTHPHSQISFDRLAIATNSSTPLSPLVEKVIGMERRQLSWKKRIDGGESLIALSAGLLHKRGGTSDETGWRIGRQDRLKVLVL